MGDVHAAKGREDLSEEFRYVMLEVNWQYQMDGRSTKRKVKDHIRQYYQGERQQDPKDSL